MGRGTVPVWGGEGVTGATPRTYLYESLSLLTRAGEDSSGEGFPPKDATDDLRRIRITDRVDLFRILDVIVTDHSHTT